MLIQVSSLSNWKVDGSTCCTCAFSSFLSKIRASLVTALKETRFCWLLLVPLPWYFYSSIINESTRWQQKIIFLIGIADRHQWKSLYDRLDWKRVFDVYAHMAKVASIYLNTITVMCQVIAGVPPAKQKNKNKNGLIRFFERFRRLLNVSIGCKSYM